MKYCTGKLPARFDSRTLRMGKYLTPAILQPPPAYNVLPRVYSVLKESDPTVLFPMDGNDQYGDCTFAAKAHAVTAFRGLIGQRDILAGPSVVAAYLAFTGGQDTGADVLSVMTDWRQNAFDDDKILAFAALKPKNHVNVMQATYLFGGVYLGFQVQQGADEAFDARQPWTPGPLTGDGHAVFLTGYTPQGGTVLTWGNTQEFTWAWWDECVDESYAILPPEAAQPGWCPGVNVAQLQADLALVTA